MEISWLAIILFTSFVGPFLLARSLRVAKSLLKAKKTIPGELVHDGLWFDSEGIGMPRTRKTPLSDE